MSERLRGCENTFACDCVGAACLCVSLPLDVFVCLLLALRVCVFVLMSSTPSIRHVVKCVSHSLRKKLLKLNSVKNVSQYIGIYYEHFMIIIEKANFICITLLLDFTTVLN